MNFSKINAVFLVVLATPVLCVSCVLIYISLGSPLFFKQRRRGLGGKSFEIVKFRTMKGQDAKIESSRSYYSRTTKISRFLRRSKVDEIPQLINIIKGDMNFFGPRALLIDSPLGIRLKKYTDLRTSVKPGIVGLAQVKNLDHTNPRRRIAADVLFIRQNSIRLRLIIFVLLFNRLIQFTKEKM